MMKDEWKECFPGGGAGRWHRLEATLHRRGEIRITRATWERLGATPYAAVLFNEARQLIGVKPLSADIRDAHRFVPRGIHGGMCLRVASLEQDFSIYTTRTLRFSNPTIDRDGMLILDLTTTRIASRVIRKATPEKASV